MKASNMRNEIRTVFTTSMAFIAAVSTAAAPCAAQGKPGGTRPDQAKLGRKTTDPPVAAQGKLGQDLFLAVDHRDLAGVKALLKRGADPNARNGLEFTPLYMAAASHQPEVMEALLAAGAKVDAPSPYGTPLSFAALGGHAKGMSILLAKGANPSATRADGISVLMLASRMGAPDVINDLVRRKADVNGTDNDGATPLIYAAREGHVEAARALLSSGAKIDATDSHGQSALMYAAMGGHADLVKFLLEKGAKPNSLDSRGRTALLLATRCGDYPDVVRALVAGGADANFVDPAGQSASGIAAFRGRKECAAVLGSGAAGRPTMAMRDSRKAVQASLTLLETSMSQFAKKTGCVSCHQEGLGRMATGAAQERGFRTDLALKQMQLMRINGGLNALQPLHTQALKDPNVMKQVPLIEIEESATGDCWILAGLAAHKVPATPAAGAMAMVLARQQSPDGHWNFSLPRVPMQSSFFTFTALAIRSMKAYAPTTYASEVNERVARAKKWLLTAPAKTSEDRASRLLGLQWAGASMAEKQKSIDEIRADQRPDGGWSQLPNLQSDAYATGQALYALHVGGAMPVSDSVYDNGVQYLLRTQDEDGSWFVSKRALPANNYFDAGFPHGQSQYSSFNGTCWAMMALLQTLDAPKQQASGAR